MCGWLEQVPTAYFLLRRYMEGIYPSQHEGTAAPTNPLILAVGPMCVFLRIFCGACCLGKANSL